MRRLLPIVAVLLAASPALAAGFEKGQRWSCVTDQGADAFLDVLDVEGDSISFSWGVLNSETKELTKLCDMRDALSVKEMSAFCRLLGAEFSDGHVMLREGCGEGAAQ